MPSPPPSPRAKRSSEPATPDFNYRKMSEPETNAEHPGPGTFAVTARMLRKFLPGQRHLLAAGLLLVLASSVAGLLQPWPLKLVMDCVIGTVPPPHMISSIARFFQEVTPLTKYPTLSVLTVLCLGLLIIEVLMAVCQVLSAYFLNSVALRMVFKLRCELFDHVQRQSLAFHDA